MWDHRFENALLVRALLTVQYEKASIKCCLTRLIQRVYIGRYVEETRSAAFLRLSLYTAPLGSNALTSNAFSIPCA